MLRVEWALLRRGWDGWTRTSECGSQSPVPYHLATPQHSRSCKTKSRSGRSGPSALRSYGVDAGTRTRDTRNHNPMLYQLNYIHHKTLARLKGLEPLTHCLEGSCSIHLSYRRIWSG